MRRKKEQKKKESTTVSEFKIDFSFRREVFFIIAGALMGAISYVIPITVFAIEGGSSYYLTWIVFGHIAGVYSPITSVIIAGFMLHILTATSIGIISGLFLYKTNILNISKPSNGLKYGLFVGSLVFAIFAIPVQEFVLGPEYSRTLGSSSSTTTTTTTTTTANKSPPTVTENSQPMVSKPSIFSNQITFNQLRVIIDSLIINLTFGITLGLFSSFLSSKFGTRYRCPKCDISFSRVDSLQHHLELIHGSKPIHPKRILILGGGFAGVEVLRRLQSKFQTNVGIEITMVSKDNYMLFTPMLHEVASGMIETRHIVTPIRAFCNRSRFYSAIVEDIDLKNKRVIIRSSATTPLGNTDRSTVEHDILELKNTRSLYYDYLVIALGSETKFFGMSDVQQNAFTMKSLNDAINLRNHIVYLLEQSDQLPSNYATTDTSSNNTYKDLQKRLLTFVIVGGGFAGVETAGEINDFIKDSAKDYYHNIDSNNIRTIIIQSGNRLLPEMSEELAEFALQKLRNSGVEVILNTRVVGATANSVKLSNDTIIPTKTLIWSGGVSPNSLITNLTCEHDKSGRIVVDKYLEVPQFKGVYALGDCAYITELYTGKPCPPTAQHAIREGAVVAKNIISTIADERRLDEREAFNYKTKGMMASIGKRTGIGNLLGIEVQGFLAWWIWRNYYLVNLPTLQKKIRVMSDWMLDIFFKRDVTMLKTFVEEEEKEKEDIKTNTSSI
jgi:NADH dehydrogenase FAD-containing subunit